MLIVVNQKNQVISRCGLEANLVILIKPGGRIGFVQNPINAPHLAGGRRIQLLEILDVAFKESNSVCEATEDMFFNAALSVETNRLEGRTSVNRWG